MSDESEIIFRGPGPFHLPVAQRATAHGDRNNAVTMTLDANLPGRGPDPEPVSMPMSGKTARALAVALLQAADEVEREK